MPPELYPQPFNMVVSTIIARIAGNPSRLWPPFAHNAGRPRAKRQPRQRHGRMHRVSYLMLIGMCNGTSRFAVGLHHDRESILADIPLEHVQLEQGISLWLERPIHYPPVDGYGAGLMAHGAKDTYLLLEGLGFHGC